MVMNIHPPFIANVLISLRIQHQSYRVLKCSSSNFDPMGDVFNKPSCAILWMKRGLNGFIFFYI